MANNEFAEFKQRLKSAPLAERFRIEMQRARELGLSITPDQLVAIASPSFGRTRLDHDQGAATVNSHWSGVDIDIRRSMQAIVSSSSFGVRRDGSSLRDTIMELDSGRYSNPSDLGALVTDIQSRVDVLTAAGDLPEMMSQVDAAFARTVFSNVDAGQSEQGLGGAPNYSAKTESSK